MLFIFLSGDVQTFTLVDLLCFFVDLDLRHEEVESKRRTFLLQRWGLAKLAKGDATCIPPSHVVRSFSSPSRRRPQLER